MKHSAKKLVTIALIAFFTTMISAPIQVALAAEPLPSTDKATTDKGGDSKIPGDPCVAADDLRLQAFIEESLDPGKAQDKKYGENTEVRNCFRVTHCQIEEVDDTFLNFLKKENAKKIKKPVCRTELKKTCADEYKSGFNEITKDGAKESRYCQRVTVFLTDQGGAGLIYVYVGTFYRWAASVIGIITVLLIIANGIIISASAGDSQAVTNAKNRIFQSLAALAILFLSGLILNTVNPNFFT